MIDDDGKLLILVEVSGWIYQALEVIFQRFTFWLQQLRVVVVEQNCLVLIDDAPGSGWTIKLGFKTRLVL